MKKALELWEIARHRNVTLKDLEGYYKVDEDETESGYVVVDTFWNPESGDEYIEIVRNFTIDNWHDNRELYRAHVNQGYRRAWLHKQGAILVGDTVKVISGKGTPIGKAGVVKKIRHVHDKNGRYLSDYVCFEDGTRVCKDNCSLIKAV